MSWTKMWYLVARAPQFLQKTVVFELAITKQAVQDRVRPVKVIAMIPRISRCFLVGLICVAIPRSARAECNNTHRLEILKVNKKAMAAYSNMEFAEARDLLTNAVKFAEKNECQLDWIHALTLMNLSVLSISGMGRVKIGQKFMMAALKIRPEAPLDKSLANPKLRKIYEHVRKKLRITEKPKPWPKLEEDKPPEPTRPRPTGEQPPDLPLVHNVLDTAPRGKPLPITCKIQDSVKPARVLIFYRKAGESSFSNVPMKQNPGKKWTWEGTIPADAFWGSTLQYYIQAKDPSDKTLAASGSFLNPHILSITSEGGASEAENPFKGMRIKKKTTTKPRKHRFWVQVGPIYGFGLARGRVEVTDENGGVAVQTGEPYDKIETPGMATGSFGGVVEFGYFFFPKLPKLLLTVQGRFGYIKMFTKNVPDAAMGDGAGSIRARYFVLNFAQDWLRLYTGGGLGFAIIRHAVKQKLDTGTFTDTDKSMGIMPQGFAGLTIGKNEWVRGYVEVGFLMTIWNDADLFTFHMDFSAGACISF